MHLIEKGNRSFFKLKFVIAEMGSGHSGLNDCCSSKDPSSVPQHPHHMPHPPLTPASKILTRLVASAGTCIHMAFTQLAHVHACIKVSFQEVGAGEAVQWSLPLFWKTCRLIPAPEDLWPLLVLTAPTLR